MELAPTLKIHGRITGLLPTSALLQGHLADVSNHVLLCSGLRDANYPGYHLCILLVQNREFLCDLATACVEVSMHSGGHGFVSASAGHFHVYDLM